MFSIIKNKKYYRVQLADEFGNISYMSCDMPKSNLGGLLNAIEFANANKMEELSGTVLNNFFSMMSVVDLTVDHVLALKFAIAQWGHGEDCWFENVQT